MDGMVLLFGSAPPHTSSSSSRLVLSSPRPAAAAQPLETDSRGHSSSLIREPYSGSHSLLSTLYISTIPHTHCAMVLYSRSKQAPTASQVPPTLGLISNISMPKDPAVLA